MNPNNMTPVDWAKRPVLEKYADFTGRAPRAEYWWYVLAVIIGEIIAMIIDSVLGTGGVIAMYGWVWTLFILATLIPSLAVSVRRLHDLGRSGWWLLVGLIPIVGAIILLVWFVTPGDAGENSFGPDPYGDVAGATVPAE
jgi:uncharacterized membrane protein YhaH (DUF805 family)